MSESELQPGEIIAKKYTIVEPIGVGGSATVYRARQVGMAQEVALKVMHAEHPDSDNEKIRFQREAEFVMKLQHPHVVPLLDFGHTEDDIPFLVFALLVGQSLEAKIRSDGSMPWAKAGRLAVHVLKALEKAHSLGVVHRDIKPANIFLCSGVLGEVAQVLDFGLAKMVKEVDTDLTQAGALLGTPRYMAPEQVRGETITHAADIYAFGLVMAEMLLGRPLVTGAKELDIYVAQGSDKPIFVPDEVLSTPYGNIIQRAVTKKVEVRYHMASQMLADVQAALDNLEGPQDDLEADLDCTRMIDPSMAAVLTNPHAEKMRRVLNAAANKKAADAEKKAAKAAKKANPAGVATSAVSGQPVALNPSAAAKAERPTHVPPRTDGDAPAVVIQPAPALPSELGPPPPIPAAAYDDAPAISSGPQASSAAPHKPASDRQPSPGSAIQPLGAERNSGTAAMVGSTSAQSTTPAASTPQPRSAPQSTRQPADAGPANSEAIPGTILSGGSSTLMDARPKPKQTGLVVALILVIVLILGGVGAILWLLGLLPQ